MAGLIVPLHVGVVLSSDPKGTTAPQQDHLAYNHMERRKKCQSVSIFSYAFPNYEYHLSPRYGLHSAALLVVPVQECENHFRPSVRGHLSTRKKH